MVLLAGVPGDGPRSEPGNVEPGARVNGLLIGISNFKRENLHRKSRMIFTESSSR